MLAVVIDSPARTSPHPSEIPGCTWIIRCFGSECGLLVDPNDHRIGRQKWTHHGIGNPLGERVEVRKHSKGRNQCESCLPAATRVSNVGYVATQGHSARRATGYRGTGLPRRKYRLPQRCVDERACQVLWIATGEVDEAGSVDCLGVNGIKGVLSDPDVDYHLFDAQTSSRLCPEVVPALK